MNPNPLHMPIRRVDHAASVLSPALSPVATVPHSQGALAESDLPLCMQPGWDPETPGREAQARFLDACIAEGVNARERGADFDYWLD